jgi:hypothetical protein
MILKNKLHTSREKALSDINYWLNLLYDFSTNYPPSGDLDHGLKSAFRGVS